MRKIELEMSENEIFIFDWDDSEITNPEFIEDVPIHVTIDEAIGSIDVSGYGKHVSKLIYELSGYSWVDKFYLTEVARLLKMSFPNAGINWQETSDYLDQIN